MTDEIIRVVLVDDHVVVRSGLKTILKTASDINVVGEASNGRDGVATVVRHRPDVVVMDLSMAQMDGLSATKEIVAKVPSARVLVLTMHTEEEHLLAALDAGAAGYLVKVAAERELVDAVRAIAHGDMYVQPRAARVLAGRALRSGPGSEDRKRLERLTGREQSVLKLVAEGYSGPDVGAMLEISAKTVDTYKQRINDKLGLGSRPEYVRFALRVGLLTPEREGTAAP